MDDSWLDLVGAFLLLFLLFFVCQGVMYIGNIPFVKYVGLYWIPIIFSLLIYYVLLKSEIKANGLGIKVTGTVILLGLIGTFIVLGYLDNPKRTVDSFCNAVEKTIDGTGNDQAVNDELTPKAQNEWRMILSQYSTCEAGSIQGNTVEIYTSSVGNMSAPSFTVTLVQGNWGIWKIDHFSQN